MIHFVVSSVIIRLNTSQINGGATNKQINKQHNHTRYLRANSEDVSASRRPNQPHTAGTFIADQPPSHVVPLTCAILSSLYGHVFILNY